VGNADGMKSGADEKIVEAAGKTVFIEEKLEEKPDDDDASVEPDGIVPKHGENEGYGSKLEGTVEQEHWAEAANPPSLLSRTKAMSSPIEKKALDSRPDKEEKGAKCGCVLEGRRETVCSDKEDEELEDVLEVGVEEALCYPNRGGQVHPMVLVVEARNQADRHQLKGEGEHGDGCQGNEEEEQLSLSVIVFWVLLAQVSGPLDENSE